MSMELILRGAADTVMTKEQKVLPPSRAFMDGIIILVRSKLLADIEANPHPKKSQSLSLFRGSVRDIHFCIGSDIIPAVKEKPVKGLVPME